MPAGDGISFTYGNYSFDPRPLFVVDKEMIKTASNTGLATKYTVTLEGNILPTDIDPIQGNKAGLRQVLSGASVLRTAFAHDFQLLKLQCNDSLALISGYPKVVSVNVANASDNYIKRADYTITLEMPSLTGGPNSESLGIMGSDGSITGDYSSHGLISLSDEFAVEFSNEQVGGTVTMTSGEEEVFLAMIPPVFSIQRTLSAKGDPMFSSPDGDGSRYIEPWVLASGYVTSHLGLTPEMTGLHDLMSLSGLSVANNYRNITVNKTEGTVDATETFIAYTGTNPAIEEFEVSTERGIDTPFTSVSINGTVQGLSTIYYNRSLNSGIPKIQGALQTWKGISGALIGRAQAVYSTLPKRLVNPQGTVNAEPLSETIGYNITEGVISYNYSYDDRPVNCYTGALSENISFTYNHRNDVFASLVILGRAKGPLFQAINTYGPVTRELSIDAIVPVQAQCATTDPDFIHYYTFAPEHYGAFVTGYQAALIDEFDQVFVNSFTETWEPKIGHFTLNKSWTVGNCT